MASYNSLKVNNSVLTTVNCIREAFFIKTFAEKLNLTHPFFIQARIGTAFTCINEINLYLNSFDYSKNNTYIVAGVEELIEIIDNDDLLNSKIISDWKFYKENLKLCIKFISKKDILTIKNIIDSIYIFKNEYEKQLLIELKRYIFIEDFDKNKPKRVYNNISMYTSKYIAALLDNGFSHLYLFNRIKYLTQKNNYGNRTFEQQFDYIFNKISNERSSFSIYFLISNIKGLINNESKLEKNGINILSNLNEKRLNDSADKIKKKTQNDKYLEVTVEASDYMAASFIAKKTLDKTLDVTFYSTKINFEVSDFCVVKSHKGLKASHSLMMSDMNKNVYKEESLASSRYPLFDFTNLINSLEYSDKSQVLQSLRYVRLAREIHSNEQKILNLWISLESLFFWKDESTILSILNQYVPKIYAQASIISRLDIALKIAKKSIINILDNKENINLNSEDILEIFSNDDLSKKVFENLNDELFKYQWSNLNDIFKSESNIFKQMKNTELDVSRQIRRIYFLRNKISHTGYYTDINPITTLHLMDYVQICYVSINKGLSELLRINNKKYTLEEIFTHLDLKNEKSIYNKQATSRLTLKKMFLV